MSHKKIGPDRFSRFDVYWIQTNKQTNKPNLYIDDGLSFKKIITYFFSHQKFGLLDNSSAFKFENFLGQLKKKVR